MSTPLPGFEDFENVGGLEGRRAPRQLTSPSGRSETLSPSHPPGAPRSRRELAPGAVHVPGWLTLAQQRELVTACRGWARGPAPIRHTKLPRGGVMSVQTVCIGWHWQPYAYTRTADDVNGARVAEFPDWMVELGRRALVEAYQDATSGDGYTPDTALINFYDAEAKLGMHQDKEERSGAPVVSLSIGDTCVFRFGNTETRTKPYTDIELASGDLFVFGGPSRFAYHGVPKVRPGTCDPASGLTSGRLNITMRVTGLG
ncbi:alpha-ketoglutarate-dependent dioxygenase AlkB [Streptomyces sp. NPDC048483]|uniref:alpha-ketoglutarate-dependent dioxygenase AlkB family protein n=1 Tax=Streptomyces sp. NPDC048483 TaxID=3154927 RepID=UPI0034423794